MDAFSAGVGTFPLMLASEGERVRVVALGGGEELNRKLCDLGLIPGCEVTVISRNSDGPMIIGRGDLRLALGTGMAFRVMVARLDDGASGGAGR